MSLGTTVLGATVLGASGAHVAPALGKFDLILCRNVLIYFHRDQTTPLISQLGERLLPDGWLMIGHSDFPATLPDDLAVMTRHGVRVFRPAPDGAAHAPANLAIDWSGIAPPAAPAPARWAEPLPLHPVSSAPLPAEPLPLRALPTPAGKAAPSGGDGRDAESLLGQVRGLADAGKLAAAATLCNEALAAHPLDHRLHYHAGLIALAGGAAGPAEAALRRAIYLCKDMAMAHYQLALLLLRDGALERGRRQMAVATAICASLPPETLLAEGDGLSAGDILAAVRPMAAR